LPRAYNARVVADADNLLEQLRHLTLEVQDIAAKAKATSDMVRPRSGGQVLNHLTERSPYIAGEFCANSLRACFIALTAGNPQQNSPVPRPQVGWSTLLDAGKCGETLVCMSRRKEQAAEQLLTLQQRIGQCATRLV
jgi:hypothetical protein